MAPGQSNNSNPGAPLKYFPDVEPELYADVITDTSRSFDFVLESTAMNEVDARSFKGYGLLQAVLALLSYRPIDDECRVLLDYILKRSKKRIQY